MHTARGRFIVLVLVAGFGSTMTVVGVAAVSWTETADFCGRCHTMGPELKAYAMSPHREVACAECHVEPGAVGWVKAKLNGTRQLIGVLTGRSRPRSRPRTMPTCRRPPTPACAATTRSRSSPNGGPVTLVLQDKYREDEPNTQSTVALVIRPAGFGGEVVARGVHWHIDSEVDYIAPDPRAQKIDYVRINRAVRREGGVHRHRRGQHRD